MTIAPALFDAPAHRKARGAFFTPPELCRYLVGWAIRSPENRVLEPSCGEAAFLLAAAERFSGMGALRPALDGIEAHRGSAGTARRLLAAAGHTARVEVADFFTMAAVPTYDAVIGNPPYVRYQDFSGEARARGRAAALRAGVELTGLASSWAAFTVHAAEFLRPGGRLALVLPAELLSVNYAAEVRRFLLRRFARVRLVVFTDRVFPGVLEEIVLLLADGVGPGDHCEVQQVRDIDDLLAAPPTVSTWRPRDARQKWTPGLLSPAGLQLYSALVDHDGLTTLKTWGETTLGAVTGNNRFFTVSAREASHLGLTDDDLLKLSPPGSRHLRKLDFGSDAWEKLAGGGGAALLFRPPRSPSPPAAAYIAEGERQGVHQAYKCRARRPWWRVPIVPPADLLLTYMNADTPRLTTNGARAHHLNSVHGVYLAPEARRLGRQLLPLASLNTLTLLGAEVVGRSYGGGMLKIEPGEADLLPVPAPALVQVARSELLAVRPRVVCELEQGSLVNAARLVDEVLLVGQLGLRRDQIRVLEESHAALTARRVARGATRRGR